MVEAHPGVPPEDYTLFGEPVTCAGDGLSVSLWTRSTDNMLRVQYFTGIVKHYSETDVKLVGDGDYDRGASRIGQTFVQNRTGRVNASEIALRGLIDSLKN